MDKELWTQNLNNTRSKPWPCPNCHFPSLKEHDNISFAMTAESKKRSQHEDWEEEFTKGVFSCILNCTHCRESIAVLGTYTVVCLSNEHEDIYLEVCMPTFFSSSPNIIVIPETVPSAITNEIQKAFQLYWCDPSASINRIRSIIELLLTELGIGLDTVTKGTSKRLTLHTRIELLKAKNPELAEHLLAIKWSGNAGSHIEPVFKGDVLDAFQILEEVLDDIYLQTRQKTRQLSQEINSRKKPLGTK